MFTSNLPIHFLGVTCLVPLLHYNYNMWPIFLGIHIMYYMFLSEVSMAYYPVRMCKG